MNGMFNWPIPDGQIASEYLWVFWVVTIPLTLLVYMMWVVWFKFSQKKFKSRHEEGLKDIEKDLKLRMRSATTMTF